MSSMAPRLPLRSRENPPARKRSPTICERRFPEDTAVKFMYLPPIRALLALNRGDPAKAIDAAESRGVV